MQNGSVGAVMKALAGKRNTYAYKPDLLLANAKTLVSWYICVWSVVLLIDVPAI